MVGSVRRMKPKLFDGQSRGVDEVRTTLAPFSEVTYDYGLTIRCVLLPAKIHKHLCHARLVRSTGSPRRVRDQQVS